MSVDCQWIEKNLEGLFCNSLNTKENQLAREHIETCETCEKEVHALNAIDPLVKHYFQRGLVSARQPRALNMTRAFGLSGAALTVVAVLLFFALRPQQLSPVAPAAPAVSQAAPPISVEPPPPARTEAVPAQVERSKPSPDQPTNVKPIPSPQ